MRVVQASPMSRKWLFIRDLVEKDWRDPGAFTIFACGSPRITAFLSFNLNLIAPRTLASMHRPETWVYTRSSGDQPGQTTFRPVSVGDRLANSLHRMWYSTRNKAILSERPGTSIARRSDARSGPVSTPGVIANQVDMHLEN